MQQPSPDSGLAFAKGSFLWTLVLLAFLFAFAFFLRTWFSFDHVLGGDFVRFAGTDAWYHMRLVDSLVEHFPHRIVDDPYLHYPGGQAVPVAPFFDFFVAAIVLLLGMGSASPPLVDAVSAFIPPLLGASIVLPTYLIGRRLFTNAAGLFAAALVAVFPGQLLARSLLGAVDHHVAESLFSALAIAFLLLALRAEGSKARVHTGTGGLFLGLYLLTWTGGSLFVFILAAWVAVTIQIRHWRGDPSKRLALTVVAAFAIALLMVVIFLPGVPLFGVDVAALVGGALGILALLWLSSELWRRGAPKWAFPACAAVLLLLAIAATYALAPGLLRTVSDQLRRIVVTSRGIPVGEAEPLLSRGPWSVFMLDQFMAGSILAVAGLVLLGRSMLAEPSAEKTLLLIWLTVTAAFTFGQIRFFYYLTIPVALLVGWTCERILVRAGRRQELAFLLIVLFLFMPNAVFARLTASSARGPSADWHEALSWVRANTPEPFGDPDVYYDRYQGGSSAAVYSAAPSAYGVMSWWDAGYWIIRVAHRVPNANPTQNGAVSAAEFFLADDEATAAHLLEAAGSKYVVVDSEMPLRRVADTGILVGHIQAMITARGADPGRYFERYWMEEEGELTSVLLYYPEYYRTMMSRLYAFGGEPVMPLASTYVVRYEVRPAPDGSPRKVITEMLRYASYTEALSLVREGEQSGARIVGTHPLESCVPLDALRDFRLVHASPTEDEDAATATSATYKPSQVQVFEFTGAAGEDRAPAIRDVER